MARAQLPQAPRPDKEVVIAWIEELRTLADQVDTLAARATEQLGEEGERLGRLDPLSLTYQFAGAARKWAGRLEENFLKDNE